MLSKRRAPKSSSYVSMLLALLSLFQIDSSHWRLRGTRRRYLSMPHLNWKRYLHFFSRSRYRRADFATHYHKAMQQSDTIADDFWGGVDFGGVLPLLLIHGRLFCRRSHKSLVVRTKTGPEARAWDFVEMASYGLEMARNSNSTGGISGALPILLLLGDGNGCDITTFKEEASFPRLTWSVPATKYGTDTQWCHAMPAPSYETWKLVRGQTRKFRWKKRFAWYARKYPWEDKLDLAVWRGSSTYDDRYLGAELNDTPRGRLVQLSVEHPELIDAGFHQIVQQYAPEKEKVANQTRVAEKIKFERMMKFRAILDIDGNSWSSRFPKLLCTNSVVIKIEPDFIEHLSPEPQPMVHYVPASLNNVTQVASYVLDKENDAEMKSIVKSANAWCRGTMTKKKLAKATLAQLERYSRAVHESIPKESINLVDVAKELEECTSENADE